MTRVCCPLGCEGAVTLHESQRWGRFYRCSDCGHEWRDSERRTEQSEERPDSARVLRARIGALTKWARTEDREAATRPARQAFMDRFEREVDPDGRLDPHERAKRAACARRAHMTRLALRSAEARQKRAKRPLLDAEVA